MERRNLALIAGLGCATLLLVAVVVAAPLLFFSLQRNESTEAIVTWTPVPGAERTQEVVPTLTPAPERVTLERPLQSLVALYKQLNPGVVNIQVYVQRAGRAGQGAGSGFVLDEQGHIVTNNHVVAGAQQVTVIFYDGTEAQAEIIGVDADSDLAVIQVTRLPTNVHPLPLGNSDEVQVGEWVVAIGNPFGLGSSMTLGIVSAIGRSIASGATPFDIPQAIQTDAAINPGNSGGPLISLQGEVIGVNAQIATGGGEANAGVGFAIPANVVRLVAPVLVNSGTYQWPWLGVEGASVDLALMEANELETQHGAYIDRVVSDSPAARAGLQGSTGAKQVYGLQVPVGGDVIVEANGAPIQDFSDLLVQVAFQHPDDTMTLTLLRDGQRQQVTVQLAARPSDVRP